MTSKHKKQKRLLRKKTGSPLAFGAQSPFANISIRDDDFFSPEVGNYEDVVKSKYEGYLVPTNRIKWLFALVLAVGLMGSIYRLLVSLAVQEELTTSQFELKAIDSNGYPVAGALVSIDGKELGTTDTFGEWRSYLKVNLSQTHFIRLEKNLSNRVSLLATKNVLVKRDSPKKLPIFQETLELQGHRRSKKSLSKAAKPLPRNNSQDR